MRAFVPDYDLVRAGTLSDAAALLAEGWRPIAGGTDLMVLFNAGTLPYRRLVSIRDLPELKQIVTGDDYISIGSVVTYTQIRESRALQEHFPLLCLAASWTGAIANQNRGTLGGNIVNASPAADSSPVLLVYDAELKLIAQRQERWVSYSKFHTGYKEMDRRDDELVAEVRLPRVNAKWKHYCRKVGTRKAQAISKVCLAACALQEDGTVKDIRIGLGSVAPVPLRAIQTEDLLRGQQLKALTIAKARETLKSEITPIDDIRSTAEYRTEVAANLLGEFLQSLL